MFYFVCVYSLFIEIMRVNLSYKEYFGFISCHISEVFSGDISMIKHILLYY